MDSYTDVSFCACHPCFHDCHATCEHCSKYFVDHKIRDEIRVQSLSATQGLSDQIHFKPLQLYLFTYPYGPKTMSLLRKVRRRSLDDVTLHIFYVIRCVHKTLIRTYVLRCTNKILRLTRLMHTFAHTEWYACPHHYGAHNPRHH